MKYPYSEYEFLQIQKLIYSKKIDIIDEGIIPNIEFKILERPILYSPPNEARYRKFTVNINPRLHELNEMRNQIVHELLWCLACDRASQEFISPTSGFLKYIERERYFKISIYDLFSYRERIAYLIYELFDRKIIKGKKSIVDFNKIHEAIGNIDITNFDWISDSEMEIIKHEFNELKDNSSIKEIVKFRHAFTHRSSPGIDCMSLQIHEYKRITGEELKMQREFSRSQGDVNWEEQEFISISGKSSEPEIAFKVVRIDMLTAWEVMSRSMKVLIENIKLISDEVEELIT